MPQTRALVDNTSFAGVMRLFCPDRQMHQVFLGNYPAHRTIDEQSLADFLTALALYGKILLDSSSRWNERHRRTETTEDSYIDGAAKPWAEELIALLPPEVSTHIFAGDFSDQLDQNETDFCKQAFDIMCSPLKDGLLSDQSVEIPGVYSASDYAYRPIFEELNARNGGTLSPLELSYAMYLHRGLFLQAVAHAEDCIYMPYHHRGEMLAKLSPLSWVRKPRDDESSAQLPLARGHAPNESEDMRKMNEFYYALLETVSWRTYDRTIPFIGACILAKSGNNLGKAFEIALQFRQEYELRAIFHKLHHSAKLNERAAYELVLADCKEQLEAAARHLGVPMDNPTLNASYTLATSAIPKAAEVVIKPALQLLPNRLKQWGHRVASLLLRKSALQMLFLDHAKAMRHV